MRNNEGEMFVAHGWRRTFLTEGIDQFGFPREVIKKQMGHLPEGKVNRAYDSSQQLKERRQFLKVWGEALVEMGLKL